MNATTEAGPVTRERHCEKHNGRLYFEACFPAFPDVWTGRCDLCEADERLERQARAILAARSAERRARIAARSKPDEKQIAEAVDAEIERRAQAIVDEMESHRFEFEAEVRRCHWETAEEDVETEMLAEIVEQLRNGNQA